MGLLLASTVTGKSAVSNDGVQSIIDLLKDMVKEIQKEQKEAAALFKKVECDCNDYSEQTTKSIGDAETRIPQLEVLVVKFPG